MFATPGGTRRQARFNSLPIRMTAVPAVPSMGLLVLIAVPVIIAVLIFAVVSIVPKK